MTNDNPSAGNGPARLNTMPENEPDVSAEAKERLATFADWTQTTPPETIVDAEGCLTDEFLAYCVENGVSLDWVLLGDAMPLVMESFHRTRRVSA